MDSINQLFEKSENHVKEIFDKILQNANLLGTVVVETKKTSIHLKSTFSFAGIHPKRKWLDVNIVSNDAIDDDRINKIDQVSKNRYHNYFRLSSVNDIDETFLSHLKSVYVLRK